MGHISKEDTFREPFFSKPSVKIFVAGIFLIILSSIISTGGSLFLLTDPPYNVYLDVSIITASISRLFMQVGLLMLSLSFFIVAIRDNRLSGETKKGFIISSGVVILAFAILMIFQGIFII